MVDAHSGTHKGSKLLDWGILLPSGPALAHHVGCVLNDKFYIHGGITKYRSTTPTNKLYCLNFSTMIWDEVRQPGSPTLSHHACVTMDNRYMILIGGWNGHKRTTGIYIFDTKDKIWYFPTDSGFSDGAGLSSHAARVLSDGSILVVGREGSLRTEKLHGCAYRLKCDVKKEHFIYSKLSDQTCSRSGHTLNGVGNVMYIVGGREDDLVEFHNGFSSPEPLGKLNCLLKCLSEFFYPLQRVPNGRKNHITISGKDCFFIHGGETFDGRYREAVGDMFLIKTMPQITFYYLGQSSVNRASHVCVSYGDRIFFHGGRGWKNVIYGDCYELKFHPAMLVYSAMFAISCFLYYVDQKLHLLNSLP